MSTLTANRTRFAQRSISRVAYDPGISLETAGLPLVLLHDLLADRSAWSPIRERLSNRVRTIAIDARGHGASPTLTNRWYTIGELVADVVAVLDAEHLPAVHLVGHGLGGVTAFDMAVRHPERVLSLTLIAPSLYGMVAELHDAGARLELKERRSQDQSAADAAYKNLLDRALDEYLTPRRGADWREALTKPRASAIRRHAPSLAALLPAIAAYTLSTETIRSMTIRTLIIDTDHADRLDLVSLNRLADQLPTATRHILPSITERQDVLAHHSVSIGDLIDQFIESAAQ